MPGQALPAAGPRRFGRQLEACEPALEPEKAHEHRVSLEPNERNFLSPRSEGMSRPLTLRLSMPGWTRRNKALNG